MTNHWVDIKNADVVLIMGGNAAEAHPCGFKWVIEAKHHNKAKLVVVDPRFTRSAAMSDFYAPIRAGSDIAFLAGVVHHLLSNDKIQTEYVRHYTNAPFIVGPDYQFNDGLFSGYNDEKRNYDATSWGYAMGDDGFAKVDMTMTDPQCVLQVMKRHYSRYTPEMVSKITGTPIDKFKKVCEYIASTSVPTRTMTIMYALGWTPAQPGLRDDPHGGDRAAAARQHRRARRRHERAPRPQQHPGPDGPRPAVDQPARLPLDREGQRADARRLPEAAHAQAASPEPDELLAELPEVLRQSAKGVVGSPRRRPRTAGPTTTCPRPTSSTTCCRPSR